MSTNQVITKRIITDIAIFVDKPTLEEIRHLKVCGFHYEKGQWIRSQQEAGLHPSKVVLDFSAESEA